MRLREEQESEQDRELLSSMHWMDDMLLTKIGKAR